MDIERQRVKDDLRGIVGGDVLCDPITAQLYASDASIYQLTPLAVSAPNDQRRGRHDAVRRRP